MPIDTVAVYLRYAQLPLRGQRWTSSSKRLVKTVRQKRRTPTSRFTSNNEFAAGTYKARKSKDL